MAATTSIPDESNSQAVFGISLSALPDSALVPDIFVPKIVRDCVEFLRKNAIRCKGLFRMAGFVQKRNNIREKLNRGIAVAFGEDIGVSDGVSDCHTVADLLKRYLRELPEPPVPGPVFSTYRSIVAAEGSDITASVSLLARLADTALPPLNYNLLKYVCLFLNNVALFHDENDMDAYNLAVIFTPNLLQLQEAPGPAELAKAPSDWAKGEVAFVRCLIENADFIFCNPYQPPTRAHIKVVSNSPKLPPINMSTPVDPEWLVVFEPLKKFRESEKPRSAYRPVKYIPGPNQVQVQQEKERMSVQKTTPVPITTKSDASVYVPSPELTNKRENTIQKPKAQPLGNRRISQSLDVIAPPVVDEAAQSSSKVDARTLITTVSSRINMAESGMDKLKRDFTILTTRIGHV